MRIGQFSDTFYPIVDGVGRVVFNYAKELSLAGDECYVVAPMVNTGYRGGYPFELIDYRGATVPGSPQYKTGPAVLDRHYTERIESVTLDVAHAHTPFFAGQEALRLAVKHDVPLIGTFHSKYYDDFYKATGAELIANLGVKYVVEFYERCDEVWAVSAPSADVLRSYGFRGDIAVMENGTEMRPVRAEDKALALGRFSIPADIPVFLYVGQLNWKKNILRILEAFSILKKDGMAFTLVLAGQGPDEEAIRAKAEELAIASSTVFTGHISDTALLDGLYQAASLFVFPSLYDTFSLVMREAAAMYTPSVLTEGGCAASAVTHGVNGLVCPDSSPALAQCIERHIGDPAALAALGIAAHDTIPVEWKSVISDVRTRYAELIRNSGSEHMQRRHAFLRAEQLPLIEKMNAFLEKAKDLLE